MDTFPRAGLAFRDADEYDEQTRRQIEYIRAFIVLNHHVTRRQDFPSWRACRGLSMG